MDQVIKTGPKPQLAREILDSCIHCGLCLPACPTYLATGRETESPRGRIYLIANWQSGKLPLSDRMAQHLESCLGCLGCQTACPSGVQYEQILDSARPYLAERRDGATRHLMRLAFKFLLPNYQLLRLAGFMLRLWQLLLGRDFLRRLATRMPSNATLSPTGRFLDWLAGCEQFLPVLKAHVALPAMVSPKTSIEDTVHTKLFCGCVMDVFYNHVNHSTIRLLLKQGKSVEVPSQTCCGALAYHAGESDIALALAKKNIAAFGLANNPIVVTSAGCGAMLKHYGELFAGDSDWAHRAEEFSKKVKDVSEILAEGRFENSSRSPDRPFTYHAACHLAHGQNVRTDPVRLLTDLVEPNLFPRLIESEHCCGSAGIYNLFNTELSLKVLDRKLDHVEETGAETIVTGNPGCQLQLEAGIRARHLPVRVCHLAEFLDEHY